jgi:flagellar biosynthesis activator protein FlaF
MPFSERIFAAFAAICPPESPVSGKICRLPGKAGPNRSGTAEREFPVRVKFHLTRPSLPWRTFGLIDYRGAMSISAYRRRKEAEEMPREMERRAFMTTIGKLLEGREKGGRPLIDACYLNQQLWTALMLDLALPQNGLPDDLKARLISIAIWVQRYTPTVLSGGASVDPLISVNRNILEGLSMQSPAPPTQDDARTPQLNAV